MLGREAVAGRVIAEAANRTRATSRPRSRSNHAPNRRVLGPCDLSPTHLQGASGRVWTSVRGSEACGRDRRFRLRLAQGREDLTEAARSPLQVDAEMGSAYSILVTNDTSMSAEHLPASDEPTALPSVLDARPEDASARAFETYSYERFMAAVAGALSLKQLAEEVKAHVEQQLPPPRAPVQARH
jgi:hypothetical protein